MGGEIGRRGPQHHLHPHTRCVAQLTDLGRGDLIHEKWNRKRLDADRNAREKAPGHKLYVGTPRTREATVSVASIFRYGHEGRRCVVDLWDMGMLPCCRQTLAR